MECIHFTHTLTAEPKHVQQAAYLVLHTICFHRCLGTVRPAFADAFGSSFPIVADADVDALLRAQSIQLALLLTSAPNVNGAELIVSFLDPSKKPPATTDSKGLDSQATSTDIKDRMQGVVTTAASAASSLKAWAAPKTLQYGWLAQAFSGGAGQAGHAFMTPANADPDNRGEDVQSKADIGIFEQWKISFALPKGHEDKGRGISAEMKGFVARVLEYVGENKAHLPAAGGAEVRSYPISISCRAIMQPSTVSSSKFT